MEYVNEMQTPLIEKVVVNIGAGESGEKLVNAEKLLKKLTGVKPTRTTSRHRVPTWGIKKREPIGCKVTLRGKTAQDFLRKAFVAADNKIKKSSFDNQGNFSFGVHEYIDFPDMKYDPDIGIFGTDICVNMGRPGYRTKRRKLQRKKIPGRTLITKEESIEFIKKKFDITVV